jgi:hypothetical protein
MMKKFAWHLGKEVSLGRNHMYMNARIFFVLRAYNQVCFHAHVLRYAQHAASRTIATP